MATSNQQLLTCAFNPEHWYFKHQKEEHVEALLKEKATIRKYYPSSGTILFELQENSAGYKIWNITGKYVHSYIPRDGETPSDLLITKVTLEAWYKPVNEVEAHSPFYFRVDEHYWNTFGRSEVEGFMRWMMKQCHEQGNFQPIKCVAIEQKLCEEGYLTDFGDQRYIFTLKALRTLAGGGFYKPL